MFKFISKLIKFYFLLVSIIVLAKKAQHVLTLHKRCTIIAALRNTKTKVRV